MEKQIKEYFINKNNKLRKKLLISTLAKDNDGLNDVMMGILGNVALVFGEVPQVLAPFYALALEEFISSLTPRDEDKKMLADLKKGFSVSCVTVSVEAFRNNDEE